MSNLLPDSAPSASGRTAGRSVFWSAIGQCFLVVVNVGWVFIVPKTLGPSHYGLVALMGSLLDLQGTTTGLGMLSALAYYFPRYREPGDRPALNALVTGYATVVRALGLAGALVAAAVLRGLEPADTSAAIVAMVLAMALLQNEIQVMGAILYAENRMKQYGLRFALQFLLVLMLTPLGYVLYGLPGAVLGRLVAMAVTLGGLIVVVRPWRYLRAGAWPSRQLAPLVRFGTLAMFSSLAAVAVTRGGNVVLAGVGRPTSEVATFAIALGFVLAGQNLLVAVSKGLTPGLADRVEQGEPERAAQWVQRAARYQTALAVLGSVLMVLLGRDLLALAVGPKYSGVWLTSAIVIWSLIPLSLAALAGEAAVAWGRPELSLQYSLAVCLSYTLAVGLLGAWYGLVGAGVGMSLAAWLSGLYVAARLRSLGGPAVFGRDTLALIALAVPGVLLALCPTSTLGHLGLFALFAGAFMAVLLLARIVPLREVREIIASLRHAG